MQLQAEIDDLGFCLSFNCYFPDSVTAMAAAKVSREFNQEETARFHEFTDFDEEDFEFYSEAQVSHTQIDLDIEHQQFDFPVSDSELLTKEINYASSNSDSIQLHKFYANQQYDSPSSSSSESDEFGVKRSGFFCMWSPKSDFVSKSGSTGSRSHGSRRWRIQNFLRRSSSEGEESPFFLRSKKTDATKQNRNVNSGEVTKVDGESSMASFHQLFYVQKRAQQKREKMKSFLPYRQDLVGLFVNINRIRNKKSPF